MLDQLRRLVSPSGQPPSVPPNSNDRQRWSRAEKPSQPQPLHRPLAATGSLGRVATYSVAPHLQRMRPHPPQLIYGPNGRVIAYDEWMKEAPHVAHVPPKVPVSRHLSATPTSKYLKDRCGSRAEVFVHPTAYRQADASHGHRRLLPSRSLDSIHPHLVRPPPAKARGPDGADASSKSSGSKFRDFLQKIKDSVSSAPSSNSRGRNSRDLSPSEWLLHRPSPTKKTELSQQQQQHNHRPSTPGVAAIRKIFSRSPSPALAPPKRPGTLTRLSSNFMAQFRPAQQPTGTKSRSPSRSSSADSSSRGRRGSDDRSNSSDIAKVYKILGEPPNIVHTHSTASPKSEKRLSLLNSLRGDPDGATFPRETDVRRADELSTQQLQRTDDVKVSDDSAVMKRKGSAGKRKYIKRRDAKPSFRVRRRQSQRHRRSRRSRKKKDKDPYPTTSSALSGAKLVSDWTYLPIPTSTLVKEEPVKVNQEAKKKETELAAERDGWESDLYQVLIERPRRHLPPPMWDPLIFVPPERRRHGGSVAVTNGNPSPPADSCSQSSSTAARTASEVPIPSASRSPTPSPAPSSQAISERIKRPAFTSSRKVASRAPSAGNQRQGAGRPKLVVRRASLNNGSYRYKRVGHRSSGAGGELAH